MKKMKEAKKEQKKKRGGKDLKKRNNKYVHMQKSSKIIFIL